MRVVVLTDAGVEVGEVETFLLSRGSLRSMYGFDGVTLTSLIHEAKRLDELDRQRAEAEAEREPFKRILPAGDRPSDREWSP